MFALAWHLSFVLLLRAAALSFAPEQRPPGSLAAPALASTNVTSNTPSTPRIGGPPALELRPGRGRGQPKVRGSAGRQVEGPCLPARAGGVAGLSRRTRPTAIP